MKITFNGAAHTVTGSQYLVEANGHRMFWNVACSRDGGRKPMP